MAEAAPALTSPPTRIQGLREAVRRRVPPARLLWILLAGLAAYGIWFLATGIGLASAIGLPLVAAIVDLLFQRVRFERIRFPDAAIATGLFLAVLLPPVVPWLAAGATTVAAITLRHALRRRGRPWFNPAAAGVVIGALFFGLAPAWWGSISEALVIALGLVLVYYQRQGWRLPVFFLGAYAGLAVLERVVFSVSTGAVIAPNVLLLTAVDPTILFFGLFMVVEPRTAPSDPATQTIYAIVIAASAATLPIILPTLAILVALIVGNLLSVALRRGSASPTTWLSARRNPAVDRSTRDRAIVRLRPSPSARWSVRRRVAAGLFVFVVVGGIAAATYSPGSSQGALLGARAGGGGGSAVSTALCQADNASVASSTLQSLHKSLGPSVVLSYNAANGVVVFFDPVNSVTVTETDLYEDYGFAEFNGDDYTSVGCVPP